MEKFILILSIGLVLLPGCSSRRQSRSEYESKIRADVVLADTDEHVYDGEVESSRASLAQSSVYAEEKEEVWEEIKKSSGMGLTLRISVVLLICGIVLLILHYKINRRS